MKYQHEFHLNSTRDKMGTQAKWNNNLLTVEDFNVEIIREEIIHSSVHNYYSLTNFLSDQMKILKYSKLNISPHGLQMYAKHTIQILILSFTSQNV